MSRHYEISAVDFDADMLDARELSARYGYCVSLHYDLEAAVDEAKEALEKANTPEDKDTAGEELGAAEEALSEFENAETEEGTDWNELRHVRDDISMAADNGEAFIAEPYFEDYVRGLVSDIGYIPADLPAFIGNNIDWSGVAEDLKVDYSSYDFGGRSWLLRDC